MKNKLFFSKILFLTALLVSVTISLSYAQETAQDVIKIIQEKSKDINSYQAKFILKMQGPQGEMAMNGDIKFKRPDKLKMELALPNVPEAKQLMISDGNTMWQYIPALKMASSIDVAGLKKEFGDMYLPQTKEDISQPLKDVQEDSVQYLGKENAGEKELLILEAKPKALPGGQKTPFTKIKIWIDAASGLEQKASFYDETGKEVLSRAFENVKTNLELADSEFSFSPPEGVQIMDMTANTRKMLEEQKAKSNTSAPTETEKPAPVN